MPVPNSTISWTESTWSPVTGCTKVSPGCDNCYAETLTERFNGRGSFAAVTCHPDRLAVPVRWKRPRRIFVNSTSDLFHKDIPDGFIASVFAVMAVAERHTFQVLTKRHARMRSLLSSPSFSDQVHEALRDLAAGDTLPLATARQVNQMLTTREWNGRPLLPLRNVWLGVSVENQQWADIRIPALWDTPAAVRWISAEPLLGPVRLPRRCICGCNATAAVAMREARAKSGWLNPDQAEAQVETTTGLDWVVVGGESGRGARPMHPDWATSLRDECAAAGVPFHFKQWGAWAPAPWSARIEDAEALLRRGDRAEIEAAKKQAERVGASHGMRFGGELHEFDHRPWSAERSPDATPGWVGMRRDSKKANGRLLDGVEHDDYPTLVEA